MTKVNSLFFFLVLALKQRNETAQEELLPKFHRIGNAIVAQKGWFHPFGGEEWQSLTDECVIVQAGRYVPQKYSTLIELWRQNRFAFINRAIEFHLCDVVRKLVAEPKLVALPKGRKWHPLSHTDPAIELGWADIQDEFRKCEECFVSDKGSHAVWVAYGDPYH